MRTITINLLDPILVSGVTVDTLEMRASTNDDITTARKMSKNDEDRESILISNLLGITRAEYGKISLADMGDVKDAFEELSTKKKATGDISPLE